MLPPPGSPSLAPPEVEGAAGPGGSDDVLEPVPPRRSSADLVGVPPGVTGTTGDGAGRASVLGVGGSTTSARGSVTGGVTTGSETVGGGSGAGAGDLGRVGSTRFGGASIFLGSGWGGIRAARGIGGGSAARGGGSRICTSTRRGVLATSGACSSNRKKPISEANVSSIASVAHQGRRRHGSSSNRRVLTTLLR